MKQKFFTTIRGELDTFLGWHISGVGKCKLIFPLECLTFLSIIVFRTFRYTTIICVVYGDLKKVFKKNEVWRKLLSTHFFDKSLFLSDCPIQGEQIFFTAKCSCTIECMLVAEMPKNGTICHMTILNYQFIS